MGTHPIFESDFDCLTEFKHMATEKSRREIADKFQSLCQEQRQFQQKVAELKQDRDEHAIVAKTLKKTPEDRRCWRLIGGVLCERTVGEVLPALETHLSNIDGIISQLEDTMNKKAAEITDYREKHQLLIQGQAAAGPIGSSGIKKSGSGVLV